jgi:hypothetical protein
LSNYDDSFRLIEYLIEKGGLRKIDDDRMNTLLRKGALGVACTDGRFSTFITKGLSQYTDTQHLDRIHGGGFLLGLCDPAKYGIDRKHWEYIRCARIVLLQDLQDSSVEHIGEVILCVIHGPNCWKMKDLNLAFHNMILAGLDSDDFITETLEVHEDIVLSILIVDWTPDETVIRKKRIVAYKVSNTCRKLIPHYLEIN